MKKSLCLICLCLFVFLCLAGCNPNPQIVKEGPLVREDFNFYQKGQLTQNPDVEEDGWIYLSSDEATARGIQLGATREEIEKVYPSFVPDADGDISLTYDGYVLNFSFGDDDTVYSISCQNSDAVLRLHFYTELSTLAIILDSDLDASTILYLEPWLAELDQEQMTVLFQSAYIIEENDDIDDMHKLPYLDALTPEEQTLLGRVMEIYEQVGDFPE